MKGKVLVEWKTIESFECPAHMKLSFCPYEKNLACRSTACSLEGRMITRDNEMWIAIKPIPPTG